MEEQEININLAEWENTIISEKANQQLRDLMETITRKPLVTRREYIILKFICENVAERLQKKLVERE